jgi:ATP-dependent DNA helicase RecG
LREVLHNCIAHQDYLRAGRVNVVENPDSLLFTNVGDFIPGTIEEVICRDAPPERYRNPFLAQAMVNLNMIDTIGSGIKRMFEFQRRRFFPLPDYDLSEPATVKVRVVGKIIDENYTRLLIQKTDLDLMDVIALDKVQKKCLLSHDEFRRLKAQKLVEGRRPNLFVSARIAAVTGGKADYIKHLGFDKEHYRNMVRSCLEKFGEAKRYDLDRLLLDKISDALTSEQKANRVRNLLQEMRCDGTITVTGRGPGAIWKLSKPDAEAAN